MDCTNAESLGDNYVTEIESCDFSVDNGGLYDPSDNLAELHWLASFLDEPLVEKVPKSLLTPCFRAETKDIHAEEQRSDELRSSISVSKLERSSCSGKIASFSPEMTAPGKARSDKGRVPIRNFSLTNLNMVLENCADSFVSANAAVSSDSDHLVSVQAKSHLSNRVSKTYQVTETKLENVTMIMKCINCGTQKAPRSIAGAMGPKTLCIDCSVRGRSARHLHHFVSELEKSHASNENFKTNQGLKRKGQDAVQVKKCMHCGIRRTPQWRAGPMGPKTLCNACGVRYRSGRLLPEYMPAASPNFSVDKHSNSHKVVLERRGQKEFATRQASEAKETYSGSEEQYVEPSQEELENSPNSSTIFANAPVCSGLDYSVSKQPRFDSLKRILKSNQGIVKKGQDAMKVRKCMQCSIQKTQQWRDGPMGPKTLLCNNCSVRYRSEKLFPEYRPAASHTFSVDKHTNSQQKVLERRDQKEFDTQASQENKTYFPSEVPQNTLENFPKFSLSASASVCSALKNFVSEQVNPEPLKKPQKKIQGIIRKGQSAVNGRKCMHCSIKKTPQWRDGPMGPKTLCNACGVRYRSGRLLPEYRPAASPTFSVDKHSNSHKKVLEMRSQKEFAA